MSTICPTAHPGAVQDAPPSPPHSTAGWWVGEEAIMGTAIRVELWARSRAEGEAAIAAVLAEMHRIDAAMSPHKPDSELSRINREAATRAVPLSAEMTALLHRALAFSRLSRGAFDVSYAAAGHLYDYRSGIWPSEAALADARPAIGWRHLRLDPAARTLRFLHPHARIDLGGFAKGHAVDNACRILQRLGIGHAYVSAGGDSRALGDRRGRPWHVAIRDPLRADGVVAVLPLADCALSTSGDYERGFVAPDGRHHHHIIDPATGRSPRGVRSVTVLADDGLTAEAVSKTVFVLGARRGLAFVEGLDGVDAVVVDERGALHFSAGLATAAPPAPAARPAAPVRA
jgi:thiamine biosynthesis lipoprotein